MRILIRNGLLIDPSCHREELIDLSIKDSVVDQIAPAGSIKSDGFDQVIESKDHWIVPGLVDLHVHFREPGFEKKETIATGSRAAVLGGYTSVCCMPNTSPVNDSPQTTRFMIERGQQINLAKILPIGAVTKGSLGKELSPLSELYDSGCVAFSDDGEPIYDAGIMRRALEWCKMIGAVISCHEEDKSLSCGGAMNESEAAVRLGLPGIPGVAEDVMVARDIELSLYTGCRVHICHVSTARSLELIRRAKNDGIPITCEVTPHHLHLTHQDVGEYDTNSKMSPPLRSEEDVIALRDGLRDGTVDAIASDHAPHDSDSKCVEFCKAAFGIIGLQTNLPLLLDFVRDRTISNLRAIELLSTAPAKVFNLNAGSLKVGKSADLAIIDPDKEWIFNESAIVSKSLNSPFIGKTMKGAARDVIVDGQIKVLNGTLAEKV